MTTTTATNAAIEYVESLHLSPSTYQCYETWTNDDTSAASTILSIFEGELETQFHIEVPSDGVPVRWVTLRIFHSPGGRDWLMRGQCLWFNPAQVDAEVMAEHNRNAPDYDLAVADLRIPDA